jgi:hypothetical protein
MWKKILVLNVDRHRQANKALNVTRSLAAACGAEIIVAELQTVWRLDGTPEESAALPDESRKKFVESPQLPGRILSFARREDVDVIVLERPTGAEPGRLARVILRDARRPVLLIPSATSNVPARIDLSGIRTRTRSHLHSV